MKKVTLPRYTIGADALKDLEHVVLPYGRKVALIHGEKAYAACKALLIPHWVHWKSSKSFMAEATYENVAKLTQDEDVQRRMSCRHRRRQMPGYG
ncbi:MAG: hypothetical protein ACLSA6_08190 [Holdemania massiliensis]